MSADNYGLIYPHPDGGGVVLYEGFASDDFGPIITGVEKKMTLTQATTIAQDEYYEYGYSMHLDATDTCKPAAPEPRSPTLLVTEFNKAFRYNVFENTPRWPELAKLRGQLLVEEAREFLDAYINIDRVGMADGLADLVYVAVGTALGAGINLENVFTDIFSEEIWQSTLPDEFAPEYAHDILEWSESTNELLSDPEDTLGQDLLWLGRNLGMLIVLTYSNAQILNIPLQDVLPEVHRSNMSKLGPDGQVVLDSSGKIMKGPHYFPPNLQPLLPENT